VSSTRSLIVFFRSRLLNCRIDNDNALRSKVDEALAVYDEYIKTQGGGDGDESKKEEKTEVAA
jgi:polyadenylate-binding protein